MYNKFSEDTWNKYLENELLLVSEQLEKNNYFLDGVQPHTKGERFLMQNITTKSGGKLILLGTDNQGNRIVVKATRDKTGAEEIEHERACRALLHKINFTYKTFHTPTEIAFWKENGFTISIQKYIDQLSPFIERPIQEQFNFALQAFKIQESAHATTKSHYRSIAKTFGIRTSDNYKKLTDGLSDTFIKQTTDSDLIALVSNAKKEIFNNLERIEQYCGFLTHTDFVPHNIRIKDDTIYLLDCSSLEFGNKHESWARFLNFMTLYNRELETLLIDYVEQNRSPEERESLQLMRIYRLIEIITYYAKTLSRSSGDLKTLNQTRVTFWGDVLNAELRNKRVATGIVETYKATRDQLRSQSEKERQIGLH